MNIRKWNFKEDDDGTLYYCDGLHEKTHPCTWTKLTVCELDKFVKMAHDMEEAETALREIMKMLKIAPESPLGHYVDNFKKEEKLAETKEESISPPAKEENKDKDIDDYYRKWSCANKFYESAKDDVKAFIENFLIYVKNRVKIDKVADLKKSHRNKRFEEKVTLYSEEYVRMCSLTKGNLVDNWKKSYLLSFAKYVFNEYWGLNKKEG